jgi:tetratricopeptide (TPR) repeat protein
MTLNHAQFLLIPSTVILFMTGCATQPNPNPNLVRVPIPNVAQSCAISATPTLETNTGSPPTDRIAVTAQPVDAATLVNLGYESAIAGNREDAVRRYELALKWPDNNWPTHRIQWRYGWAMFQLGDYGCALARFEAASKEDPQAKPWMAQTFAVTWWQLGQRDLATDWYNEAIRNDPSCWREVKSAAQCAQCWRPMEKRALAELLHARRVRLFGSNARAE